MIGSDDPHRTAGRFDIEDLLELWTQPIRPDRAADAFRRFYLDPVLINGTPISAEDLAHRAAALRGAFDVVRREVIEICDGGDKIAVAFRLGGRHVGPLMTAAGELAATGQELTLSVIDILTLRGGRISEITMVANELAALFQIGAVKLEAPTE